MPFNGTQITEYKDGRDSQTGTLARGSTFNNEFNRLYDNDNYLKAALEELEGLSADAPAALNTLKKIAAALGNDPAFAANYNNRIYAASQRNLVYNYDFRYFSNQASVIAAWYDYMHPDGYIYSDNGTDGKIGYDTTLKCCKIMTSTDGSGMRVFKQALHEFVNWRETLRGSTVTLKAFIKGNAIMKLADGVNVTSHLLQNTGAIEEVELQIEVSNLANELTFSIESSTAANVIEVYKVYANRGQEAIESLSCIIQGVIGEIKTYDSTKTPSSGEFELNGIELPENYSRLDSFVNKKFGVGGNGRSKLNTRDGLDEYSPTDYTNMESVNRISTSSGHWENTIGDGSVKIGVLPSSGSDTFNGNIYINEQSVMQPRSLANSVDNFVTIYPVQKNDIIRFSTSASGTVTHFCYYIPPSSKKKTLKTIRWC